MNMKLSAGLFLLAIVSYCRAYTLDTSFSNGIDTDRDYDSKRIFSENIRPWRGKITHEGQENLDQKITDNERSPRVIHRYERSPSNHSPKAAKNTKTPPQSVAASQIADDNNSNGEEVKDSIPIPQTEDVPKRMQKLQSQNELNQDTAGDDNLDYETTIILVTELPDLQEMAGQEINQEQDDINTQVNEVQDKSVHARESNESPEESAKQQVNPPAPQSPPSNPVIKLQPAPPSSKYKPDQTPAKPLLPEPVIKPEIKQPDHKPQPIKPDMKLHEKKFQVDPKPQPKIQPVVEPQPPKPIPELKPAKPASIHQPAKVVPNPKPKKPIPESKPSQPTAKLQPAKPASNPQPMNQNPNSPPAQPAQKPDVVEPPPNPTPAKQVKPTLKPQPTKQNPNSQPVQPVQKSKVVEPLPNPIPAKQVKPQPAKPSPKPLSKEPAPESKPAQPAEKSKPINPPVQPSDPNPLPEKPKAMQPPPNPTPTRKEKQVLMPKAEILLPKAQSVESTSKSKPGQPSEVKPDQNPLPAQSTNPKTEPSKPVVVSKPALKPLPDVPAPGPQPAKPPSETNIIPQPQIPKILPAEIPVRKTHHKTSETNTKHVKSVKGQQPPSKTDLSPNSRVALISIGVIAATLVLIVMGVWYRKISVYNYRYGGHTLLTQDDEEFGVFNRLTYNEDVKTYDSWRDVDY